MVPEQCILEKAVKFNKITFFEDAREVSEKKTFIKISTVIYNTLKN